MEFIFLSLVLLVLYFLFITARQAIRETRYYEWLAEQDELYYQEVENSISSNTRSDFHE